ncbi:MAG: hypothetical protein WAL71_12460 [Terriglobales bacterium]|jgi:hypothetical protein
MPGMWPRIAFPVAFAITLAFTLACSRPTALPDSSSNAPELPFNRGSRPSASSDPSLVPFAARLSEGTFLTVRLSKPLSSASAHAGDSFEGTVDDPIMVDQQTLLPRGTPVSGRVLDAKPSAGLRNSGYLRITLVSVNSGGKTLLVDTSSIFSKGALPSDHPSAGAPPPIVGDVVFTPDRRLTFRLAQSVDLP